MVSGAGGAAAYDDEIELRGHLIPPQGPALPQGPRSLVGTARGLRQPGGSRLRPQPSERIDSCHNVMIIARLVSKEGRHDAHRESRGSRTSFIADLPVVVGGQPLVRRRKSS